MFYLNTTRGMAASSFNTTVLGIMESDALNAAALCLQRDGKAINPASLVREADSLIPHLRDNQAVRMFFATRHQTQDDSFDNIKDLAAFLLLRTIHSQEMADVQSQEKRWSAVILDLTEGYSYVIEAAHGLIQRSMVAARRIPEVQALVTIPDAQTEPLSVQLFIQANALYEARQAETDTDAAPRFS